MSGPLSNPFMFKSAATAAGFYTHQIANSVRVENSSANSTATNYFYRDGDAGNRDTWTLGMWIKRARISTSNSHTSMSTWGGHSGSGSARGYGMVNDYTGTINGMSFENNNGSSWHLTTRTNAMYKDTSGWTHVCWRYDSTQATEADRARMYVNGELITDLQSTTYPAQNADHSWNSGGYQFIGTNLTASNGNNPHQGFDGYIAEVISIDGTSLDPMDNLVETKNGVIIPKDPSGLTFGTNGFWLKFTNSSALGEDFSGNDNDFTVAGIAAHDQMIDTPTFDSSSNGGNFMTYNGANVGANNTLSEGNLKSTGTGGGNVEGTFGMITGKWYWECRVEDLTDYGPTFGIGQYGAGGSEGVYNIITWQSAAGQMYGGGGYPDQMGTISVTSTGVTSLADADILSFWLDCDNGKLWIGKNGTIPNSGSPANGTNPQASWSTIPKGRYFMATCQNVSNGIGVLNAGQNPTFNGTITAGTNTDKNGYGLFNYDPSGTDFLACCAANIPTAAAVDPAQTDDNYPQKLFSPLLYTGNGSTNNITGLGFQPDLTWIKIRNTASNGPLVDSTRGTNNVIFSQINGAAATSANLTAFGSDGFSLDGTSDYLANFNGNTNTYASWNWRVNGGTTATNSNGSVDSTVQVDPSGAFSIATFRGGVTSTGTATVGHGLSKAPSMIIFKGYGNLGGGDGQWWVGHDVLTSWSYFLRLNSHVTEIDKSGNGSMSAPTSTVFSINNTDGLGYSTIDTLAYSFTDVEGYCKVGSYRGNGLADAQGTYIYTGFKPAWVMIKAKDTGAEWTVYDDKRDPFNEADHVLQMDIHDAESTSLDVIDMYSNGFKCLDTGGRTNQSGKTYLYLAMAHNPFQYATAR